MTTDILFDPVTGDILIQDGELVVGDSTHQHQRDIVLSDKGHYKHAPRTGVGLFNYTNDVENVTGLSSTIRLELIADGQDVDTVKVEEGGQITIDGSYPS
ncbi:hypothetical protein [Spirosoma aerolatum]|uniref:hypothetical protein n=1 Tax=Spirosoma aerolatum TaxID=1211326 RepID=UPI0009AC9DC5|nr:hypothetical protein [Spirosoma aerolatum]